MGNLCCTRHGNERNVESVTQVTVTQVTDIHFDEKHKTENKLEVYLNDVYEKECEYKASQEEVEFIQTGIEKLVQDIVDEALDIFSTKETDVIFSEEKHKAEIKKYFKNSLVDVYFPIRNGSHFQDYTDIKPARRSIIKVGSFYEGTKNNFPDELDFIFLLFCGRDELYQSSWLKVVSAVCSCILSVKNRKSYHYASPNMSNGTREIYLQTGKNIRRHGPAIMLQFIYKNGLTKERHIAVDLVPAYKIVVINKPEWYVNYVNNYVKPKSFHQLIVSAKSCLGVRSLSFTKTEVSFIRNVLSRPHVKVYRILKFLINGHGDESLLEERTRNKRFRDEPPYKPYSSYKIKTMMIYHHDECRNSDTTDIGPCVLQVLEEMCKYKNNDKFPAFSELGGEYGPYLVDYLQSLINTLKSMQTKTGSYSYERFKIKSVTMQYLERAHYYNRLKHKDRYTGQPV